MDSKSPLPQPTNNAPAENSSYVNPSVNGQPAIISPSVNMGANKKFRKRIIFIVAIVVVLGGLSGLFFWWQNRNSTVSEIIPKLLAPKEPPQRNYQYGTQYFATGYVEYSVSEFEEIDINIPDLKPVLPSDEDGSGGERPVLFISDFDYGGSATVSDKRRLLMHDLTEHKTYVIAEDDTTGFYYNARIMSNHYIVYVSQNTVDSNNSMVVIKITDLLTGKNETIMEDKSSKLTESICCSVSLDGLRLVLPQADKLLVYQVGDNKPVIFNARLKVFPDIEGTDNNDTTQSFRIYGYPSMVWLDNSRVMFAKSHPLKWKVTESGSYDSRSNNGLAIYDFTTGAQKDIPVTDSFPIKWFAVDGDALVFIAYRDANQNETHTGGLVAYKINDYKNPNLHPTQLLDITDDDHQSPAFYSLTTKQLYIPPSGAYYERPRNIIQKLNVATGMTEKFTITEFDYPSIEGVIGPDKLILNVGPQTAPEYVIYDVKNKKSEPVWAVP